MRLNRGTIALVVIGIVVIGGVILFNNYQESNPDATQTPTPQTGGPLFADLTTEALAQVVVRDNSNGARTVLMRTVDGLWELGEPDASSSETEALEALIAALEATPEATDEATPEATALPISTPDPELDPTIVQTTLNGLIGLNASDRFDSDQLEGFELNQPPYSILITTTDGSVYLLHIGGENPSGNRYYAVQEQLSVDEMTPEPSARAEATEIATEEATAEPTEQVTDEAETEATDEATPEATVEVTAEATAEATTETTPEAGGTLPPLPTPTPAPLAEPLVTLSGTRTINTIPKTTIDQLIGYIASPPYFVPTPTPTLPFPIEEITVEPTVEVTPEATVEPTEEPTIEPTASQTDEPTLTPTRRATATPQPTDDETPEATAESTSES
jgi:hypothetical protein